MLRSLIILFLLLVLPFDLMPAHRIFSREFVNGFDSSKEDFRRRRTISIVCEVIRLIDWVEFYLRGVYFVLNNLLSPLVGVVISFLIGEVMHGDFTDRLTLSFE